MSNGGSIIDPTWESSRRERRERRRKRRRIRRQMIKGCEHSRRSFLLRFPFYTPRLTELVMGTAAWGAWGLVAALAIADGRRSDEIYQSVIYNTDGIWGVAVLAVGVLLMAIVMLDLISYRPLLLEQSAASPEEFFEGLASISPTLKEQVGAVAGARPTSWQEVKDLEQNLLSGANDFGVFDLIKTRVTLRVLQRIAALVASLALIGYGLSAVTHGGVLHGGSVSDGTNLPDHVYFTLVAFFTGFGDIGVAHNAIGYGYLAVIVGVFTGVVYFILTDVVAIQGELRLNMRAAAETFALQKSAL